MTEVLETTTATESISNETIGIESEVSCQAQPEGLTVEKGENSEKNSDSFVLKPPKSNSKLILQNMEEVLKSVKKKHKQKHKRKKEQKRLAELAEKKLKHLGNEGNMVTVGKVKEPLRDKTANENDLHTNSKTKSNKSRKGSPLKCSTPVTNSASIMNHFYPSPKKGAADNVHNASKADKMKNDELKQTDQTERHEEEESTKRENAKPANAFDLMMSARNRSLGTNPNGQEPTKPLLVTASSSETAVNRKLMLRDWSERKGAAKRRLLEEERAMLVDKKMEQRAKRLKRMLTNPEDNSVNKDETPERKVSRSSGRLRTRRLSSVKTLDAVDVLPKSTDIGTENTETSDLSSMLASSVKKTESFLNYFPKETSTKVGRKKLKPKEEAEETKVILSGFNTPSRKGATRRRISRIGNEADCVVSTPSSRPRRSCTNRARYDQDADASLKVRTEKQKKTVDDDDDDLEIIDVDNSNPKEMSQNLAPLFVRQLPKPNTDPNMLKARAEFLRSGMPEKLKQWQVKEKQWEQHHENNHQLFPCISHVLQMSNDEVTLLKMKLNSSHIKLRTVDDDLRAKKLKQKKNVIDGSPWTCITNCTSDDFHQPWRPTCKLNSLPVIDNKRNIVKAWKKEYDRFPTYKCYNQMCEKYRYFRAIDSMQDMQQVSESFVVTQQSRYSYEPADNTTDAKPSEAAPNGELLFTEKYKPLLFDQVLVNLTPVQMLRDFLANWKTANPPGIQRNYPYADDSVDFANDSSSSTAGNTIVLLGPSSSGKTNAVYALANEMNFNVLEINAGVRRTGKKLLQELQEATQSHQIRKDSKSNSNKQLLKMSLNSLKNKQQKKSSIDEADNNSLDNDLNQSDRKSLILIEDADIVFDQEAGFTDAIYTLAGSSKRPVIVVATDPNCTHLQRLMQQNTLHFFKPNVLSICRFLSVLALIENCPILLDDLVSLYSYNKRNLRKTLLELQFFVQSGGDRLKEQELPVTPLKSGCGNSSGGGSGNKQDPTTSKSDSPYFASPTKRNLLENFDTQEQQDEQLNRTTNTRTAKGNSSLLYMHHTLFEFFTCAQNEKSRIPFPVDFQLLRVNFNDILRVSDKLISDGSVSSTSSPHLIHKTTKRQSRSPKKTWLNSATACEKGNSTSIEDPLKALCSFYENISVASLLDSCETHICMDRLVSHLSEQIAHTLVEESLVVDLSARICPYNLFDTSRESPSLCDQLMGNYQPLGTRSSRALDYEPVLRMICRSEQQRALAERRSCRFYHYLRNFTSSATNFSMEPLEEACNVFREDLVTET